MAKSIKARVLSALTMGALSLKPNDILQADEKLIKNLEKSGQVDASAAAVKYCESQKSETFAFETVADPATELADKKAALESAIKELEASLATAAEADKAALQTELEAKQAELNALG